jgi:UDP-galactopyranose mutase
MRIGIFGAGIAGLAVAWLLGDSADVCVHEASGEIGGLARSFKWHGFNCDLAPHRFFTRDEALLRQVMALVPMRRIERRSGIRLRGHWIQDPVSIIEVLFKCMPLDSTRIVWHYLLRSRQDEDSFEALVLNNYGKGLNDLFFKPYSEKLFGIPASEISPSWGRRKIRVSGFRDLVRRDPRLYFKHFYYPTENGYIRASLRSRRWQRAATSAASRPRRALSPIVSTWSSRHCRCPSSARCWDCTFRCASGR